MRGRTGETIAVCWEVGDSYMGAHSVIPHIYDYV